MAREPKRGLRRAVCRLHEQVVGWIGRRISSEIALAITAPDEIIHASERRLIATALTVNLGGNTGPMGLCWLNAPTN